MKQSKIEYLYGLIDECIDGLGNLDHAVYMHEFQSDEELQHRCKTSSVRGASCFNEGDDICEIVTDIIYDAPELIPWMKLPGDEDLRLVVEVPACGKKFLKDFSAHDWADGALTCDHIVVILGKKLDFAGCLTSIFVRTAYPE